MNFPLSSVPGTLLGTFVLAAALTRPIGALAAPRPKDDPEGRDVQSQLDELRDEIEDLRDGQVSDDTLPSSFTERLNALNPRFTAFGDFLARIDDERVENEDGDPIDDRFNLREVELDFSAAIDTWASGRILVTLESETPGEFAASIEEGHVTLERFPGLDSPPLGLRVRIGRIRPSFGRLNVIHLHDLPQVNYPFSLMTFLGEEGFVQNGISASIHVPTPGENNDLGLTAALVNGGDIGIAEDNGGEDLAGVGRANWFWSVAPAHEVEFGLSGYTGRADAAGHDDARMTAIDASYFFRSLGGRPFSLLVAGEAYYAEIERGGTASSTPVGGHLMAQVQLARRWYLSGRFDYTESIDDDSIETRTPGVFLTYEPSEFQRYRIGYERRLSDDPILDDLDTFWFRATFVFGSHPAEPYWVNR